MKKKSSEDEGVICRNDCGKFDEFATEEESKDRAVSRVVPQEICVGLGTEGKDGQKFVALKLGDKDGTVVAYFAYKAFKEFVGNLTGTLKKFEKFGKQ